MFREALFSVDSRRFAVDAELSPRFVRLGIGETQGIRGQTGILG
jgi:hypothetical protein